MVVSALKTTILMLFKKKFFYSTYSGIPLHVTVVSTGKKSNFLLVETIKAKKTLIFVREKVGALLKSI